MSVPCDLSCTWLHDRGCDGAESAGRYGYRRIRIVLQRRGHQLGWHRTHRLWRQAELQLPRRRSRRRIASGRPRPLPAAYANFVWAYDFVFDATAQGQQIRGRLAPAYAQLIHDEN